MKCKGTPPHQSLRYIARPQPRPPFLALENQFLTFLWCILSLQLRESLQAKIRCMTNDTKPDLVIMTTRSPVEYANTSTTTQHTDFLPAAFRPLSHQIRVVAYRCRTTSTQICAQTSLRSSLGGSIHAFLWEYQSGKRCQQCFKKFLFKSDKKVKHSLVP
jgi:hypothetical protein